MHKYKFEIDKEYESFDCIRDDGRQFSICFDFINLTENKLITYGSIKTWKEPYEDEEITLEEKKKILQQAEKYFLTTEVRGKKHKLNIDFSPKNHILNYEEVLKLIRLDVFLSNRREKLNSEKVITDVALLKKLKEYSINFFSFYFFKYCEFSKEDCKKFKIEVNKDKYLKSFFMELSKWKINEGREKTNQKYFNYGLYALEMVLCESTKEEVEELVKQYVEMAKEKNLSFETFYKRNCELNKIIDKYTQVK